MCLFVLHRAQGSKWRVLLWLLAHIANDCWELYKNRAWTTWYMYICCKSLPELRGLMDQELERLIGEDHREWPEVIDDDVEVEFPQPHS